ncbi:hypothetical protein [Streptomyces mutabilis]|uniref:Uncharacterized protein n=1 Tax=Streptomyces mutabilis TaxID=67332 RepID=A0A086MRE8_9ACTN|nr:hypothetical protein [Streptomyces mutabilis]KFG71466.1 hypothetical protein FM21_34995 [Streptomyces mutabilis]
MAAPQAPTLSPALAQALSVVVSPDCDFLQDARSRDELAGMLVHFDVLGRGVAAAFNARDIEGGGWTHTIQPAYWGNVTVGHRDGMRFSFRHDGRSRKGAAGRRLQVETGYPHGYCGWRAEPITVSMDRAPAAIAADVLRRLMPAYKDTLLEGLAEAHRSEAQRRARAELNGLIEQIVPGIHGVGGARPGDVPDRNTSFWSGRDHVPEGQVALPVGGRVTLNRDASEVEVTFSHVPPALALELLDYLRRRGVVAGQAVALGRAPRVIAGELEPRGSTKGTIEPGGDLLLAGTRRVDGEGRPMSMKGS